MLKMSIIYIFIIMIIMIILFYLMNYLHPISMILLIILYTILINLILTIWSFNFIYSIIMFLIMISGLLIIFLYFSCLISNEQTPSLTNIYLLIIIIPLMLFFSLMWFTMNFKPSTLFFESNPLYMTLNYLFTNLMKMYSPPMINMTFLCMIYLLLTMFLIIKICSIKQSSLRKIN